MRDRAGGYEISTCLGISPDSIESYAAGEFHLCAAIDNSDPLSCTRGREVIEQQVGGAMREGFFKFLPRPDFDLRAGCFCKSLRDTARGSDVVVLNQHGIEEPDPVVRDAS